MNSDKSSGYIWFDAEFTSINLETAKILQVAAIATDINLNPIDDIENYINLTIKIEKNEPISPWVKENLGDLINKCLSPEALEVNVADSIICEWIEGIFGKPNEDIFKRPILAGNSVHNDWFMMRKFFPKFKNCLHYRLLDVTTLKILCKDWSFIDRQFDKDCLEEINDFYPGENINKLHPHDALFDIKASIAEMSFYMKNLHQNAKKNK